MALARLEALRDEMQKCFRCNLCKMVPLPVVKNPDFFDGCPACRELGFHSYSGSGKQIMALSLLEGRISVDRKLSEVTYSCTTCGSCDVSCKFIMDAERQQVNMALREHMVDEGVGLPVHRKTVDSLCEHGYPHGKPPHPPGRWAKELGLKVLPREKADVLLYAGCLQAGDEAAAETCRKLARLLLKAGLDVGILGDQEVSCGLPAYWTGYRQAFTHLAEKNLSLLDSLGVKIIVTVSGSCLGAFRSKYPEVAAAPEAEVLHATEILWRLICDKDLALVRRVPKKVTYHDPCYLGRQSEPPLDWQGEYKLTHGCMTYTDPPKIVNRGCNGVYDAPRNILKAIDNLDFVEMYRIREYSFCCGGGGGVPTAFPGLARAAGIHRIEEGRAVGAEYLVTACHQCRIQLEKAMISEEVEPMPVLDIIDLVYDAVNIE